MSSATTFCQRARAIEGAAAVEVSPDGHNVYVAAEVGRESADPPYELTDVHIAALRLGSGGALSGQLRLPALTSADETFRPLTVDDDGVLYLMLAQEGGLQVLRFTF